MTTKTYKLSHTRECETLGLTLAALSLKAKAMVERAVLDGWAVSAVSYGSGPRAGRPMADPGIVGAPSQWISLSLSRDVEVEEV